MSRRSKVEEKFVCNKGQVSFSYSLRINMILCVLPASLPSKANVYYC